MLLNGRRKFGVRILELSAGGFGRLCRPPGGTSRQRHRPPARLHGRPGYRSRTGFRPGHREHHFRLSGGDRRHWAAMGGRPQATRRPGRLCSARGIGRLAPQRHRDSGPGRWHHHAVGGGITGKYCRPQPPAGAGNSRRAFRRRCETAGASFAPGARILQGPRRRAAGCLPGLLSGQFW